MAEFSYKTIKSPCESKITEKNSRFFGFTYPIDSEEECKEFINQLKIDHPKANHHCYAWRLGVSKDLYRANDDGEPSGSAGRPIIGQIDSYEITNVLVVVVRYFGGVKLGVSGLIKAYKQCAKTTLEQAVIIEKQIKEQTKIEINYANIATFQAWVSKNQVEIITEEYTDFHGSFEIAYSVKHKTRILEDLKHLTK